MVVYDLQCSAGHRFEGWFEGLKDLKSQMKKGLLSCPVCGGEQVRQVPAGFAIAKSGGRAPAPEVSDGGSGGGSGAGGGDGGEQAAQLLRQAFGRYLRENFDDVGPGFTNEALKMHYGVSETRNIRGVSTPEEEKLLKKEGVSFFKVAAPAEDQAGDGEED